MIGISLMLTLTMLTTGLSSPDVKVKDKVDSKVEYFPLREVRLLDSPFKQAMDVNADWLLEIDGDRLLCNFFKNAGLEPMAESYGGWEQAGIAGHTLGHYLTAVAQQYASTGDERFKAKGDYIVAMLDSVQTYHVDGFIGGMPGGDKVFKQVKRGIIKSMGFDLNGLWVPWYNEHKTMMGLSDMYELAGNEQALKVLVNLSEYLWDVIRDLSDAQMQEMMNCEFGGMNEAFAQVYALTGDARFLEGAQKFYHRRLLDPLSNNEDVLPGIHSNTQIPKIVGAAREYELTGNDRDRRIADNFWHIMVEHHTYANGGNSTGEYLGEPDKLNDKLTQSTCETCNTYNMLKLTQHLYRWTDKPEYIDYYERALYNHILASQNHNDGMTCYFVPLAMGAHKDFTDKEHAFTCCMGTGFENHSKYGGAIYSHSADGKTINVDLYIPSTLNWEEKGFAMTMNTKYPEDGVINFKVDKANGETMTLNLRYPAWAHKGMTVKVNGRKVTVNGQPGSFVPVTRAWKAGDKVAVEIPMDLYTWAMPDNADRRAVFYGPTLLAGDLGKFNRPRWWDEDEPEDAPRDMEFDVNAKPQTSEDVPVLVSADKEVTKYLTKGKGLTFTSKNLGVPNDVKLMPFFNVDEQFYTVYWDVFSPSEWAAKEAEYQAEKQRILALEKITTDYIQFGQMQPERDHNLEAEASRNGDFRNRKFRYTYPKGWIAFDMKVDPKADSHKVLLTFFGDDVLKDNRPLELLVDGQSVTYTPTGVADKFSETEIVLPKSLTEGKDKVRLTIQGRPDGRVTVYDCRIIR